MKNTFFYQAIACIIQRRKRFIEVREEVSKHTLANMRASLMNVYIQAKDRASIDQAFYVMFGKDFAGFYSELDEHYATIQQCEELQEFMDYDAIERRNEWIEKISKDYPKPKRVGIGFAEYFENHYNQYPLTPQESYFSEQVIIVSPRNVGKTAHLKAWQDRLSVILREAEQRVIQQRIAIVLPKINDQSIIESRIAKLKIRRQKILSMPKSQRGNELQETIDSINRLKSWSNDLS